MQEAMISEAEVARRAVTIARSWMGTPYHHQAAVKGVGCDCLGLIRGVWRELYGFEAEVPPAYTRDWAEASGNETMLAAAGRHLAAVPAGAIGPGAVVIFRLRADLMAKHAAIVSGHDLMIHAVDGVGVAQVPLSGWWRRRVAGGYIFSCPRAVPLATW